MRPNVDVVERLEGWPWFSTNGAATRALCAVAAGEIKRLRTENERLSAGIAEMEAASFELHWRSIDSVPTDGTRVLLGDGQGRIAIGAFQGDRMCADRRGHMFVDGRGFVGPATHWMPLPKAAPPAWPVVAP